MIYKSNLPQIKICVYNKNTEETSVAPPADPLVHYRRNFAYSSAQVAGPEIPVGPGVKRAFLGMEGEFIDRDDLEDEEE